jgi:phenylacetate-CoA ligase
MMSYGLFTGGLGLHYGAERVGMTVIPVGGGNTQRQVQIMKDFKTTVLHITPSYLLHIHSKLDSFDTKICILKGRF